MKQINISQAGSKLLFGTLVYVACILPFHGPHIPIGLGIGLAVLGWLLEGGFKQKFHSLISNKVALLFITVYLIYLVSVVYSEDRASALVDIQLKLSLLIFPLILATAKRLDKDNCIAILRGFVLGCFVSAIICIADATYNTFTTGENHFSYDKLSFFVQVGYYAMYLTLASILLAFDWIVRVKRFSWFHLITLLTMGLMLILLSARAQLLAFMIIMPAFGFIFLRDKLGKTKAAGIMAIITIVFAITLIALPSTKARMETAWNNMTQENVNKQSPYLSGINVRFVLWEIGTEIITENPILGVGNGDVEHELLARATEQNIPAIVQKELNFHNQYFQTGVATGLMGLLIFLASLFIPLAVALQEKLIVYVGFSILILISAFTESILERQAGVIFFAFFNSLLFLKQPEAAEAK